MTSDPKLIDVREPGQFPAAPERSLPRRTLGRGTLILLIALRIYIFMAIPIVIYAFVHAILTSP